MMLFLDTKLTKLNQEYQKLDSRYDEVSSEIDSLQSELNDLEGDMERLEAQIKNVKEKLLTQKISDINVFTDDKFTNDFIRASYFAAKCDERIAFQYINITDSELQASDTHRLIVIRCPCIPKELKNTKIKWDIRENFKDHTETDIDFPNVEKVIPGNEGAALYPGVKPENFYSIFNLKPLIEYPNRDIECIKIDFNDVKIGLNKEYLDTALMCLGGEFDLYVRGKLEPLTFEGRNTTVILLPVRHMDPEVPS